MDNRVRAMAALAALTEDAEARGDLRAVERLSLVMREFKDAIDLAEITERRRKKDATAKSRRNPQNPQKSAKSAESAEIGGSDEVRTRTTTTTTTTESHTAPAREVMDPALVEETEREEALLVSLVDPADWPDISAFVARREYRTWAGWYAEMRRLIGPGSQHTSARLAQLCRDDRILARPIGSAFALRKFLGTARQEEIAERSPSPNGRSAVRRPGNGMSPGAQQVANILGGHRD